MSRNSIKLFVLLLIFFHVVLISENSYGLDLTKVSLPHYTGKIQPTPQKINGKLVFYPFNDDVAVVLSDGANDPGGKIAAELIKRRIKELPTQADSLSKSKQRPIEIAVPTEIILGRLDELDVLQKKYACNLEANDVLLRPQGYIIRVRQSKGKRRIFGLGSDPMGTFYAASTIIQQIGSEVGFVGIRMGNIDDWPVWRYRMMGDYAPVSDEAMVSLALQRISVYIVQHRSSWRKLEDDFQPHWSRQPFGIYFDQMNKLRKETGLFDMAIGVHLYAGSNGKNPPINLADDSQIEKFITTCRYLAGKGFGHIVVGVDDYTRSDGQYYICNYEAEKKKFSNSIGRAHGYLMKRLKDELVKDYPNIQLSVVPAPYSILDHKIPTRFGNQQYLCDLSSQLPEDISVVWTGPRVLSSEITRENFLQFSNYCNTRPLWVWDNSHAFDRPMPIWKTKLYHGFENDSNSLIFINGHVYGWPWEKVFCLTANDYLWNPDAYDAEASFRQVVQKLWKPGRDELALKVRERLISLHDCRDNPARQQVLIDELKALLEEMGKQQMLSRRLRGEISSVDNALAEPVETLNVPFIKSSPNIDGKLNDPAWKNASKFSYKHMTPGKRLYNTTDGLIFYDSKALYIAFIVKFYNQPPNMPAEKSSRDAHIHRQSDTIEIFLQKSMKRGYAHMCFDIAGNMYDSMIQDPQAMGLKWNPEWQVAIDWNLKNKQWTAEVRIPFESIEYLIGDPPKSGDTWRANFGREAKLGDDDLRISQWSRTFGRFHRPLRFGYLKFE